LRGSTEEGEVKTVGAGERRREGGFYISVQIEI
jgi:hypothetical protein